MKTTNLLILIITISIFFASCGVDGDPGHCYISLSWEYINDNYRVYFYRDDNADLPDWEFIEEGVYYDSYPGIYEYYYESEDPLTWYYYTGTYTLSQNPGYSGGIFKDGLDGSDTYFDLYLMIIAKKGLSAEKSSNFQDAQDSEIMNLPYNTHFNVMKERTPLYVENRTWETTQGGYSLEVREKLIAFDK